MFCVFCQINQRNDETANFISIKEYWEFLWTFCEARNKAFVTLYALRPYMFSCVGRAGGTYVLRTYILSFRRYKPSDITRPHGTCVTLPRRDCMKKSLPLYYHNLNPLIVPDWKPKAVLNIASDSPRQLWLWRTFSTINHSVGSGCVATAQSLALSNGLQCMIWLYAMGHSG
jgi:hypothetical protein